ncbi:MAG: diguanylate cyclase [Ruminococcaceae bacterium]|nr:diguanylate cyclase [Oscillospiraceae bacterium]
MKNMQPDSNDRQYTAMLETILKAVMLIGMAATLVGGLYNAFNGYPGWPVYVHVGGFALLAVLFVLYKKIKRNIIVVTVFSYFCFIYTPFAWVSLGGLYSSMSYVVYIFFLLIAILMDGRIGLIFTIAYAAEIVALVVENRVAYSAQNLPTPFFPMAFSYLVMLSILIIVSHIYKRQYSRFLLKSRSDSITDLMTGLYNHRYLVERLDEVTQWHSENPERGYAVAIIDLDDFKQINDTWGHSTGDEVLRELGGVLQSAFNQHIVGRYGGDEFLVIFQDTPFEACTASCQSLLEQMDTNTFTEQGISVSLSIGLCGSHQVRKGDPFAEADVLLYRAKQNKKNQLCTPELTKEPVPTTERRRYP